MQLKGFCGKTLWLITGVLVPLLTSCGLLGGRGGEGEPAEPPGTVAARAREGESRGSTEVFFDLASTSGSGESAPVRATSVAPSLSRLSPPPSPEDPEESSADLVARLGKGLEARWVEVAGGLGETAEGRADARKIEAASQLLALSFLQEPEATPESTMQEAASVAAAADATEYKLLAAAYLLRHGWTQEGLRILRDVAGPASRPDVLRPDKAFSLANLAFARSIDGPGRFVAASASEIVPGKSILVYGEFQNPAATRESRGGEPAYRRSFSARLKLLSEDERDIDQLEFLPPGRGTQTSTSPDGILNFWARYKLPAQLEPGRYRIEILARDLVGETDASAEIDFVVPRTASLRTGS